MTNALTSHRPLGSSGRSDPFPGFGALVISLDFELHWGVRDRIGPGGSYRRHLLGARLAVGGLLDVFEEFEVAATWAVVGFLFAASRTELDCHNPSVRPRYRIRRLDPYQEVIGSGEADDPLHFAPSLVEQIRMRRGQEIGSHTYSHYYCLEPGQDREAFAADLWSAKSIAASHGLDLRSIVFPRNQHNPSYDGMLLEEGILAYRGNPHSWMYRPRPSSGEGPLRRAARLVDSYMDVGGGHTTAWEEILQPSGICNVPASFFLRPAGDALRDAAHRRRLLRAIRAAARDRRIVHIWWHPHNFGVRTERNLELLRELFQEFSLLRAEYGIRSLSMRQVAELARAGGGVAAAEAHGRCPGRACQCPAVAEGESGSEPG